MVNRLHTLGIVLADSGKAPYRDNYVVVAGAVGRAILVENRVYEGSRGFLGFRGLVDSRRLGRSHAFVNCQT